MQLTRREGVRVICGESITIEEELYVCVICGEEEYSFAQADANQLAASNKYRDLHRLLRPGQITALRKRLNVSQARLEQSLSLGAKTVARWEAGRVMQTRAMDNLLRAIDRHPDLLRFFAAHHGAKHDALPAAAPAQPELGAPAAPPAQEVQAAPSADAPVSLSHDMLTRVRSMLGTSAVSIEECLLHLIIRFHNELQASRQTNVEIRAFMEQLATRRSPWLPVTSPSNEDWLVAHHKEYPASQYEGVYGAV